MTVCVLTPKPSYAEALTVVRDGHLHRSFRLHDVIRSVSLQEVEQERKAMWGHNEMVPCI